MLMFAMPPNTRVVKAIHTLHDLGISIDEVKLVLKHLLMFYDKSCDLINEENYRVPTDTIFDSEEVEDVPSRNKLENIEQDQVLWEEAQKQDEIRQSLKRFFLKF
ncbi:hypothetical protein ACH5RR_001457 [Cinchona calisaya]|uniref:WIYLD domain-containing protein n=1 Tax=Cinchona calisaya TaxID=153742 RepID=A0ABD3B3W1_9GENT